ncbi:MAG: DUF438 domain-containing protein [Desulfobacteraceae bacterium]|nr:DUF438 domain-containing protein [Desulfobacteraceae bacterium]
MDLSARTKIDDLLKEYPFLLEFFVNKSPTFSHLKNPIMRKTVGKIATLNQVASVGKIELDELLSEIAREVKEKTGETIRIKTDVSSEATDPLSDPKAREEALKGIIRDLHKGEDMENLKKRFQELIQHVSPSEIANMEQRLIEEGMAETEVRRLCDVHVAVFKEALEKHEIPGAPAGHPVHTFMLENRASEEIMDGIDETLNKIGTPPHEETFKTNREPLLDLLERLSKIHIHYLRKENQLFPLLEVHDISGPSQVMWAIHDDIRAQLKTAKAQLSELKSDEGIASLKDVVAAIREMIYKEEHILYPMSLETLSDAEWSRVRQGEEEIGYAWIEPEGEWTPEAEPEERREPGEEKINLDTGFISRDLINLMLTHLPVDLTLVDEEDRVAYYSKGKERIFPRSPGIIGRKVQRCHPPDSVHIVNKILDAFRARTKDTAEFWIQMGEKFIFIRYFAIRATDGTYKGCLEVSQDVTEIRQLEGQRRLLDWD